jgi:mycothiol synthase
VKSIRPDPRLFFVNRNEMTVTVSAAGAQQRNLALRFLFSRFPLEEQAARLNEALKSAENGSLNLDELLLAEQDHLPVGAALAMVQPDGVALVWPPVVSCQATNPAVVEEELMIRLCERIDAVGSKLAQCLLSADDTVDSLRDHGFEHAADIFFLARTLSASDQEGATEFAQDSYCDENRNQFASVIERTYEGSLDCPFLNGFRNGRDAIASHRLSGQFDPNHWRLFKRGRDVVGVLMLNDHPDQDAIELVYFGILPEFRGQGFGRKMLADGIRAAARLGRSVIFLAVDCGNTYANAIYNELGFAELARRRVMLRRSADMA